MGKISADELAELVHARSSTYLGWRAWGSDLAGVVHEAARTHGGRPVKWLGDGVMFHFDHSGGAIRGGLELLEETERRSRCRRGSASTPGRSSCKKATTSAEP